MRRWLLAFALIAAFPLVAPDTARSAEYLTGVSDLPLAAGLREEVEKSTVFDTPMGRIVTAYAGGALKPAEVLDFYDDTLPQLGWERESSGTYRRKDQTLKIDVWGSDAGPSQVSFTLSTDLSEMKAE